MTITIELPPEEDGRLEARAQRQGQDAAATAHAMVRDGLAPAPEAAAVTAEAHAVLIRHLRDTGLLTTLPTHPGQTVLFQPITALGPPISQTLLEDRE